MNTKLLFLHPSIFHVLKPNFVLQLSRGTCWDVLLLEAPFKLCLQSANTFQLNEEIAHMQECSKTGTEKKDELANNQSTHPPLRTN